MEKTISIGEASRLLGLSIDTIRYYEKLELIPPMKRRESGYRTLSTSDLLHLKGISYLRACGISIDKIKTLFENPLLIEKIIGEALEALEENIRKLEKSKAFLIEAQREVGDFYADELAYKFERLKGYFLPMAEGNLEIYTENHDLAWQIPLFEGSQEKIMGRFSKEDAGEGIFYNDVPVLSKKFEFESEEAIERELLEMIDYALEKKFVPRGNALLLVYSKTSCFVGKALAGHLFIEVEEEVS